MAERPRIGVTGTARRWSPGWWCTAAALWLAGAVPERISVRHKPSGKPLHGMVIGGGDDIGPEHYNGDLREKVKSDPERDRLEIRWINHALEQRLPLLGICRGAQLINVVLGGNLYSDIRDLRHRTYNRPGLLPTKQVFLRPDSALARITRRRKVRVNSLHHQAIKRLGRDLRIVGRDLDEFTQAVEGDRGQPIIGVQWHPEYLFYLPAQFALFRWLRNQGEM
ncbi:gamma-glutamyl-gamma-aminobutyrate hydrolase family protein [Microbulbifer elongatus]|uniref:gamma-glutamyl-gamma-aminobutyrate hydrolase family protein n=1 Tax=Microbulbifer elongatus TaxID=86173 RepID=UPI001CFDA066|nr:gamma-glutamyl-gamma-aminobutyrate hydrolase family protein [Microbulbifer elongatus]